jgi:hypothetical protein
VFSCGGLDWEDLVGREDAFCSRRVVGSWHFGAGPQATSRVIISTGDVKLQCLGISLMICLLESQNSGRNRLAMKDEVFFPTRSTVLFSTNLYTYIGTEYSSSTLFKDNRPISGTQYPLYSFVLDGEEASTKLEFNEV